MSLIDWFNRTPEVDFPSPAEIRDRCNRISETTTVPRPPRTMAPTIPKDWFKDSKTPKDKVDSIICEYRLKYGYPHPKPWMLMSSIEVIDLLEKIERALEGNND